MHLNHRTRNFATIPASNARTALVNFTPRIRILESPISRYIYGIRAIERRSRKGFGSRARIDDHLLSMIPLYRKEKFRKTYVHLFLFRVSVHVHGRRKVVLLVTDGGTNIRL